MKITCRAIKPADMEPCRRILRRTAEFNSEELRVAEEVLDGCLIDAAVSGYNGLIAEVDNVVAGFVCYGPTPLTRGNWEIYWLAVDPDCRRAGIGSYLLSTAESAVKREGGRQLTLETSSQPNYAGTRLFYQRCGYHETAQVPDYYRPGDDLIIYLKKLD
ncbi:GCN5-related N-acetyltransferase [Dehalogenimonas lykanthroporepellens BL-DC-9]|jgi:ribosomal protein S18 acetylase RimI-like enzyme|nr:GCN5-related N-acetyltransferase [Dehalogenimonas lykanthroporepellens BL-DC-9]